MPSIPKLSQRTSIWRLWVGGFFSLTFSPWQVGTNVLTLIYFFLTNSIYCQVEHKKSFNCTHHCTAIKHILPHVSDFLIELYFLRDFFAIALLRRCCFLFLLRCDEHHTYERISWFIVRIVFEILSNLRYIYIFKRKKKLLYLIWKRE